MWKIEVIIIFLVNYFSLQCAGTPMNITVDDEKGDELTGVNPSYFPSSAWSFGPNCTDCLVKPDPSLVFDGSWHDVTWEPATDTGPFTIEINFNGSATASYVYFILANNIEGAFTFTNVTFYLDGVLDSTFFHLPSGTDYDYNVPVYVNRSIKNLADQPHNLTIAVVGNMTMSSLALFDYAVYTLDVDEAVNITSSLPLSPTTSSTLSSFPTSSFPGTSSPSSPLAASSGASPSASAHDNDTSYGKNRNSSTPGIVGGVIGAIVAVAIVALAICIFYRKRRVAQAANFNYPENSNEVARIVEPFVDRSPVSMNQVRMQNAQEPQSFLPDKSSFRPSPGRQANDPFVAQSSTTSLLSTAHRNERSLPAIPVSNPRSTPALTAENMQQRKGAMAVAQQINKLQKNINDLRNQLQSELVNLGIHNWSSFNQSSMRENQSRNMPSSIEMELRRQIEALQAEIERLQSADRYSISEANSEAPPGYFHQFPQDGQ